MTIPIEEEEVNTTTSTASADNSRLQGEPGGDAEAEVTSEQEAVTQPMLFSRSELQIELDV